MRAQFILSEIGIGLRRNLTMTIAVIVTTTVSLALLGVGLLVRAQVETMKDYWYDKVEVSVFLCADGSDAPSCSDGVITDEQRQAIGDDLNALPEVEQVYYESKDEAFVHFKEQFKDSAITDNVTADQMPESYRVKLENPEQFEIVESAFQGRAGVEEVQDQKALLSNFFTLLRTIQTAAIGFALIQLVAAVLLIGNTIRVAAFSRRRETGIMRLVGASNFYIQLPFLLEGAIAGLIGGLLASASIVAVKKFFIDDRLRPRFTFTQFVGWDAVWAITPILIIAGVVLATLASFFTLRKYMRV